MIGETRAASKILNLAAAASEMSAGRTSQNISESDFLAKEMDSSANDKVRSKTLRERAAEISAGLGNSGGNKASKGKVAKDADKASNPSASQVSSASRVTRRQKAQNGGGHAVNKETGTIGKPSSSSEPTSGSSSELSERTEGDVVGDILELQEKTHGSVSIEPPAKKARDKSPASFKPGGSQDSPGGGFDISLELLGAIKSLNSSITNTLTTNVSGIRDDFKGLATSMSNNFEKLSSRLSYERRDSSNEESSGESSSSQEEDGEGSEKENQGPNLRIEHQMSEGDSENEHSPKTPIIEDTPSSSSKPPRDKEKDSSSSPTLKEVLPAKPGETGEKKSFFAKKRALITPVKDTGDPLDEDLSIILADKFWGQNVISKEEFLDSMKATLRPENVQVLQTPAIQEVLWSDLPEGVRGRDKWEKLTQANLMVIWRQLAYIIDSIGKHEAEAPWVSDIIDRLLDLIGLAGFVNKFNYTSHRRELLRPALPKEYKRIAGEGYPPTPEWLFGSDLDDSVDKMAKENKLVERLFPKPKPKKGGQTKRAHFNPRSGNSGQSHGKKKIKKTKKNRKDSLDYVSPLPQGGDQPAHFDQRKSGGQGKRPQNNAQGVSIDISFDKEYTDPKLSEFKAGNIARFISNWEKITSDPVLLSLVRGVKIDFSDLPNQQFSPREYRFNRETSLVLDQKIHSLLERGITTEVVQPQQGGFVSNVFLRPKPGGKYRMILDLSSLNDNIVKKHFKMTHLDTAIAMMSQGCFMGSIDLKDAFYSVLIHHGSRKFLYFSWKGRIFQFNAMPFGLTSAPRIFTKIMKPVFSDYRARGHEGFAYLDDSFIIAC